MAESIRYADTLFSSKDFAVALRVMTLPDRKKPFLVVERDGRHIVVADFKEEDAADEFIRALEWLVKSWVVER